jgi:hypothetical protein
VQHVVKKKMLIIANEFGQLGNRLLLFSRAIAFAIDNDYVVLNLAFRQYAVFFKTTSQDLFCRYPSKKSFIRPSKLARLITYKVFCKMESLARECGPIEDVLSIDFSQSLKQADHSTPYVRDLFYLDNPAFLKITKNKKIIFLNSYYMRYEKDFICHADKIRSYFLPLNKYQNNISSVMSSKRKTSDVIIGVHIRLGDYKNFEGGRWFYSIEQYAAIMRRVKDIFHDKRVSFFISSSTRISYEAFSRFDYFFGTGHIIEDLHLLAACDYIMGPKSTYSLWASFYGKVPLYVIENPNKEITIGDFSLEPCNNFKYNYPCQDVTESVVLEMLKK